MPFFRRRFWKVRYLLQTGAPLWCIWNYIRNRLRHNFVTKPFSRRWQQHKDRAAAFAATSKATLHLDHDWFSMHIPLWLEAFETLHIRSRTPLECLEIGSWQGLSAAFILGELPAARLTCVDTWQGADEHRDSTATTAEILSAVERTFDANLAPHRDRLTKFRSTSLAFFSGHVRPEAFDLIYVDGSHHVDDVLIDALMAFEMLRVGGMMVFDDYFWRYYADAMANPAAAINAFLRLKAEQLRIVSHHYQLIVTKTRSALPHAASATCSSGAATAG